MSINAEDSQRMLAHAIKEMDVLIARALILDNNAIPARLGIANKDMFYFIRSVALLNDKPLLRQLLRYNSKLGGKVLWNVLSNVEVAKTLVQAGAALDVGLNDAPMDFVKKQTTLLHFLVASNDPVNLELADLMIRHGADVNAIDENSNSVLKCAIEAGVSNDFIVKLLHKNPRYFGSDVVTIADCDRTADLMPLIITAGVEDEVVRKDRARRAIFCLINSHPAKIDEIEALFKYDIPIDVLDYKGDTALHNAVTKVEPNLVEFLLKRNADPNKKTSKGWQPLWIASTLKESVISSLLIKYGADIHRPSKNGQRPIHGACKGGSINNIFFLIRLGADINVTDRKGLTPFSMLLERLSSINTRMSVEDAFFIRQFALAASRGVEFDAHHMRLIESLDSRHELYVMSFREIQRMQRIEAANGIPYYTLLTGSVERISRFTRREDIASVFENSAMLKDLFPCYFCDLRNIYAFAKERENQVITNERLLDEIIIEIYQISIPYLAIHKIANYLGVNDFHLRAMSSIIWE